MADAGTIMCVDVDEQCRTLVAASSGKGCTTHPGGVSRRPSRQAFDGAAPPRARWVHIRATDHLRKVPVVLLTSHHEASHAARAFASGAQGVITKPVEP